MTPQQMQQAIQSAHQSLQAGNVGEAKSQLERLTRIAPDIPIAVHLQGLCARAEGRLDEAIKLIRRSVELQPQNHEFLNTLGNVYRAGGQGNDAETAFRQAIRLKPDYLPGHLNLANVLVAEGRPSEAEQAATAGLQFNPQHAGLRTALGDALKGERRYADAAEAYRAVLATKPDHQRARHGLASCELELGKPETALPAFTSVIDSGLDAPEVHFMRARAAFELGDFDQAGTDFEHAYRHAPSEMTLDRLAGYLWVTGQVDRFDDLIAKAIARHSTDPRLALVAAKLFLDTERLDDAERALAELPEEVLSTVSGLSVQSLYHQERGEAEPALALARSAYAQTKDYETALNLIISLLMSGEAEEALQIIRAERQPRPLDQGLIAYEGDAMRMLGDPDYERLFDVDRFVRPYTLPTPNGYSSLTAFTGELGDRLDREHKLKQHPIHQSLRYGSQTTRGLATHPDPVIQQYVDALRAPIAEYLHEIGDDPSHPHTARNTGKFRFSGVFSVKLRKGGYHINHCHPEGWISSSFYVQVPNEVDTTNDRAGWIGFCEPPYRSKIELEPRKWIKPEQGVMVLFPSFMWHGTKPILNDTPRMTAPFDVMPV